MDRVTNKSVSVGTSPVLVAQEVLLGQRKSITIINTSTGTQKISLAIDAGTGSGSASVLSPGGSFNDSQDGSFYFPLNSQITAISDGAGGSISVLERIGTEKM